MVGAGQLLLQQAIERGFGGFVERGGGLVEEQELRRLQQRACDAEPLLLAERQHPVPVLLLIDPRGELRQADLRQHLADPLGAEGAGFARIGDRRMQRPDREIGLLRQHHQRGIGGNRNRAAAERPDPGNRAEQRRLAGAGGAGDQHALAALKAEIVGGDQRRAIGQPHQKLPQVDRITAAGLR